MVGGYVMVQYSKGFCIGLVKWSLHGLFTPAGADVVWQASAEANTNKGFW